MVPRLQVVIDCADPAKLAQFWADALGYELERPPDGQESWFAYWRSMGIPEEELVGVAGPESVVDPTGVGPRIWFQLVPEGKRDEPRTAPRFPQWRRSTSR